MNNIITPTKDSIKYNKHCSEFKCLNDGTITGEYRYCDLSTKCRQVDIVNGKLIPMEAHYLPIFNEFGEIVTHELFCTGMHDNRPLKERSEDDKVS